MISEKKFRFICKINYIFDRSQQLGIFTATNTSTHNIQKMAENSLPGPMTMIKIDGAKIKRIRENQGLTQLYMATAVQVTTDTISRWENRRYPSIKRENGLKLAEALSVPLEDILEIETEEVLEEVEPIAAPAAHLANDPSRYGFKKIWPLLLLSGTLLVIILAFILYYFHASAPITFTVERHVPAHAIGGMAIPVVIQMSGEPGASTSLIIREKLPAQATLITTSPEASTAGGQSGEIKWLKKVKGGTVFAYILRIDSSADDSIIFKGTAAIGKNSTTPSVIIGDSSMTLGTHHWADTDKDNTISDSEILVVYEQYSEIPEIDSVIDLIEEIWLGSGYRWDKNRSSIHIVD